MLTGIGMRRKLERDWDAPISFTTCSPSTYLGVWQELIAIDYTHLRIARVDCNYKGPDEANKTGRKQEARA